MQRHLGDVDGAAAVDAVDGRVTHDRRGQAGGVRTRIPGRPHLHRRDRGQRTTGHADQRKVVTVGRVAVPERMNDDLGGRPAVGTSRTGGLRRGHAHTGRVGHVGRRNAVGGGQDPRITDHRAMTSLRVQLQANEVGIAVPADRGAPDDRGNRPGGSQCGRQGGHADNRSGGNPLLLDPVDPRHGLSPGPVTPEAGTGPDSITTPAVAASPAVSNRRERDAPRTLRRVDGPPAEPLINYPFIVDANWPRRTTGTAPAAIAITAGVTYSTTLKSC